MRISERNVFACINEILIGRLNLRAREKMADGIMRSGLGAKIGTSDRMAFRVRLSGTIDAKYMSVETPGTQ